MRILINRSDAIGDTVLTLPVIESLKKEHPYCTIGLVVSTVPSGYLKLYRKVDYLFVLNTKNPFFSRLQDWLRFFWEFSPTHYFYVGGDRLGNIVSWLKKISYRGGLRSKISSFLFLNHSVRQSRSTEQKHESIQNIELFFDLIKEKKVIVPELTLEEKTRSIIKQEFFQKLFKVDLNQEEKSLLFIVHPGMTGHSPNWPIQNYVELIERLDKELTQKCRWVVSYTPADHTYIEEFKQHLHAKESVLQVEFFNGADKGLEHYCYILSLADGFIGPSTGTTHLASLLKCPIWTFYSPYDSQSPKRWCPIGVDRDLIHIFCPELDRNSPENAGEGKTSYDILKAIKVDDVAKSVTHFFRESRL